jgi:hypothetical protein
VKDFRKEEVVMKLMAIFFLCVLPEKSNDIGFVDGPCFLSGPIEPYVSVPADVTKVQLDFHKHVLVAKQDGSSNIAVGSNARPIFAYTHTLSPWDGTRPPFQHGDNHHDTTRDKPHAILPNSVSFSNVKKRLFEVLLPRRKEKSDFY